MNMASEVCYREAHSSPTAQHHDADYCKGHSEQHRASGSHKGRRALRDTHRRGTPVCAPGGSNNRYLNRPAIGERRDRFITRLHEIAAEFAQQPGLGVEGIRHAVLSRYCA